mmetsp:Transcript_15391/g.44076  ORF Transcript_15391/g.44076 Transcript_15391/m.44076 type:complete len:100 (+) Transcript_15391:239-538(+)
MLSAWRDFSGSERLRRGVKTGSAPRHVHVSLGQRVASSCRPPLGSGCVGLPAVQTRPSLARTHHFQKAPMVTEVLFRAKLGSAWRKVARECTLLAAVGF